MSARWSALLVWALAAASAVVWGLRLFTTATPVPAQAQVAATSAPLAGDLTRLFGAPAPVLAAAPAAPPDAASRFQLTGVVATRRDARAGGVAIVAVDGRPPRAYRVGEAFDGQYTLAAVGLRSAQVAPRGGGAGFTLELPPPPVAATGVPAGLGGAAMPGLPAAATPPGVMPPPAPNTTPPGSPVMPVPGLASVRGGPPNAGPGVPGGPPPGAMPPGAIPPGMLPPQGVAAPGMATSSPDARGNRQAVQ